MQEKISPKSEFESQKLIAFFFLHFYNAIIFLNIILKPHDLYHPIK